jgi:hypothetical protein
MRILGIVTLCAALAGCAASRQEVATRLGDQYVGQNVDAPCDEVRSARKYL